MNAPHHRDSGVTLIELLVAVAVFAVFAVMAYGGLSRLLDARERVRAEQQYWQDLSMAFTRLSDDLAHARPRRVRDVGGFPLLPFAGRPTDTRALADPNLEFTRGGELYYGDGVQSDLRRVAWRLREGRLDRLTWPALDRAPTTTPVESPLLNDVEAFDLKFYGAQGVPTTTWPPIGVSTSSSLPDAVEVTLTIKGRGTYRRLFLVNR